MDTLTPENVTYAFLARNAGREVHSPKGSRIGSQACCGTVVAPGQRRRASDQFPGLIVRVVSQFEDDSSRWICLSERTGRQLILFNDEFGELLAERG